jgi:metal-responsive CopG/Arc/MetJ family transcriptional regulator
MSPAQLAELDEFAASRGYATRADAVRAAVAEAVKRAADEEIDRSYRVGYSKFPETDEEMADAHRLALASIDEEPSTLDEWL